MFGLPGARFVSKNCQPSSPSREEKKVQSIVIDVSHPLARAQFSKPYLEKISPKFTTYYKPGIKDETFMEAIDAKWSGALPYSALYKKGKKIKEWNGSVAAPELKELFQKECLAAKQ